MVPLIASLHSIPARSGGQLGIVVDLKAKNATGTIAVMPAQTALAGNGHGLRQLRWLPPVERRGAPEGSCGPSG